jgi:hypothetical protein
MFAQNSRRKNNLEFLPSPNLWDIRKVENTKRVVWSLKSPHNVNSANTLRQVFGYYLLDRNHAITAQEEKSL